MAANGKYQRERRKHTSNKPVAVKVAKLAGPFIVLKTRTSYGKGRPTDKIGANCIQ
jgi:hypothetical protein